MSDVSISNSRLAKNDQVMAPDKAKLIFSHWQFGCHRTGTLQRMYHHFSVTINMSDTEHVYSKARLTNNDYIILETLWSWIKLPLLYYYEQYGQAHGYFSAIVNMGIIEPS